MSCLNFSMSPRTSFAEYYLSSNPSLSLSNSTYDSSSSFYLSQNFYRYASGSYSKSFGTAILTASYSEPFLEGCINSLGFTYQHCLHFLANPSSQNAQIFVRIFFHEFRQKSSLLGYVEPEVFVSLPGSYQLEFKPSCFLL